MCAYRMPFLGLVAKYSVIVWVPAFTLLGHVNLNLILAKTFNVEEALHYMFIHYSNLQYKVIWLTKYHILTIKNLILC